MVLGLVLDGGLWNDLAASWTEGLLIDEGSNVEVFGSNNNEGLFPDVDRRYKFSASVFQKGGKSRSDPDLHAPDFRTLTRFDSVAVVIPGDEIRTTYATAIPSLKCGIRSIKPNELSALTLPWMSASGASMRTPES